MKTYRVRKHIKEYLSDKPRSSQEILDYVNSKLKHGTVMHTLSNVLTHDPAFVQVGTKRGGAFHTYEVMVWALAE